MGLSQSCSCEKQVEEAKSKEKELYRSGFQEELNKAAAQMIEQNIMFTSFNGKSVIKNATDAGTQNFSECVRQCDEDETCTLIGYNFQTNKCYLGSELATDFDATKTYNVIGYGRPETFGTEAEIHEAEAEIHEDGTEIHEAEAEIYEDGAEAEI